MFWDANNLNGWAMSKALPGANFESVRNIDNFSLEAIRNDSDMGYILEVDWVYPIEIHDTHNN